MKQSIILLVAVVLNWSLLACSKQASTEEKTIKMLRDFYTAYINETTQLPSNSEKVDLILKRYSTENLRKQWQELSEKMDYDLLIDGQFCDIGWLKTMVIQQDKQKNDIYTVIFNYTVNDIKKQKKVRLGVVEKNGVIMIDKIFLNKGNE